MQDALLAIDTANQTCAVALICEREPERAYWRAESVGNRHAERILSMIDEVLAEAGVSKNALGTIAFGQGPGSFTGLRVACGVAQGLAWALNVPMAQINNLEAAAQAVVDADKLAADQCIAILNDARMQEIYAAVYRMQGPGHRVVEQLGAQLLRPEEVSKWLLELGVTHVAGSALSEYAAQITLPEGVLAHAVPESMIVSMAQLARLDREAGALVSAALAHPLYVRDRVALTIEQRARGEKL